MKHFCPLPFTHMEIDPAGDIRPCCMYRGYVRDSQGNKFNALTSGFTDVFESQWYKDMRQRMLDDAYDADCQTCYDEESKGIDSRRLRELARLAKRFENTDGYLMSMDIKLGNTCNLKCVICNPFSSSKVLEEQVRIGMIQKPSKLQYEQFKWYNNDAFWEQLLAYGLDNITHLDIMGGEPMLAKKHFDFLTRLVEAGHAHHINLNYVTNGTIYSPEVVSELFAKFASVYFTMSADATGDLFEYIRYPAVWNDFLENLRKYKAHGHSINISYSVSAFSIFDIPKALQTYEAEGVTVWFNLVYNRDRSIQSLPKQIKQQLTHQLEAIAHTYESTLMNSNVQAIITHMNAVDDTEGWAQFCARTGRLDTARGNSILTVLPQLKDFYENQI